MLKAAAVLAGLLGLFALVLLFTPIAHPRTVVVDGVSGPSTARITSLIEDAAAKQSTFATDDRAIMRAVAAFPEVASVSIDAHPPFRVEVRAIMRPPVARLEVAGRTFVVAGDGTILQRSTDADVPRLAMSAGNVSVAGARVRGARSALTILAAAPVPLLGLARSAGVGRAGVEIEMSRGPRLIFGTGQHASDKWAAAAAIIADGSAAAATYLDLRVPSRPAVGGIGGSRTAASTDDPPQLTADGPAALAPATSTAAPSSPASSHRATGTQAAPSASGATATGGGSQSGLGTSTGNRSPAADAPAATPETPDVVGSSAQAGSASTPQGAASTGGAALAGTP